MARMGMDADLVAQAGKALKDRAGEIDTLVAKLDGIVRSIHGVWEGPDSDQFVNEWWPEHKKTLVAASSHVAGLGQSALNNASEQRDVSGTHGGGSGGSIPSQPQSPPSTPPDLSGQARGTSGTLSPGDLAAYRQFETEGLRLHSGPDGSYYVDQNGSAVNNCTAWVEYRRTQLGLPTNSGTGGTMAGNLGGTAATPPTLGAAVSYYPSDSPQNGHVMVVEEIKSTNPPTIRVSEDNYANAYNDSRVWTQQPDGKWLAKGSTTAYSLVISPP